MTRRPLWCAGVGLALVAVAAALPAPDLFPHREHGAVFPVCTGCHQGIPTGDRAAYYPEAAACARCHDGVTEERVEWRGPTRRVTNLAFHHPDHATAAAGAGDTLRCVTCHQDAEAEGRMAVGPARPDLCITCHAHEAPDHLAEAAACGDCHVPLTTASGLDTARIAAFPRPATHTDPAFILNHAPTGTAATSCTVCHAQESCTRCHLNAAAVPAVVKLAPDRRIATLARERAPEYPEPDDHREGDWAWAHADAALDAATRCANCHAQASCRACHQAAPTAAIATLPRPAPGGPQGVTLGRDLEVHPAGFPARHGTAATLAEARCISCHQRADTCQECHGGSRQPAFHRSNFRERHAAEAYAGEQECASCHTPSAFCRACHAGAGVASQGRTGVAFHTAQPFWLMGHGQAARQGLASCASCHAQRDCATCHSAQGAWRVNPHGEGFTGTRAQARNRLACLTCHGTEPGGGTP